ncbi:MAG TPA: hypothetical protein VF141_16600 [Chryseolinea sp.]
MKERLRKVLHKNKEVLIIDYSNCKEAAMIELVTTASELVHKENKKVFLLSIFNDKTYVSPKFIRHVEKELKAAEHLIVKNAITGISPVQRWIVKGINLWYTNQIHPLDSVDKALDFLVA